MNTQLHDNSVITIDTESWKQELKVEHKLETFQLVDDNHPLLSEVLPEFDFNNPPVNPNQFASCLVETCKKYKALGLAANQCGFNYRVFVVGNEDNYVAFFNPNILSISDDTLCMEEGCLSFPNLFLKVERPKTIQVEYQDFTGQVKKATFSGITAKCFQHELDHLNGIKYTSYLKPLALQMAMKKRQKQINQQKKLQKQLISKVKEKFNASQFRSN